MFDYTKWQIFGAASLYLINWGDNLVLKYYVLIAEIGVYNLAYQIFKGLMGFLLIINSYFLPTISQKIGDLKALTKYLFSVRPKIVVIGLLLVAGFLVVFPTVFNVVYSKDYHEAVLVLQVLSIGIALELYNIFYATLLTASKNYKFTQMTNIVHVSLNILLNIIFVPMFGIVGAAIGTVSAYLIRNIIYETFIFSKYKKLSIFYKLFSSTI
jgi:O-antigen/teichoic acid export membrane protein